MDFNSGYLHNDSDLLYVYSQIAIWVEPIACKVQSTRKPLDPWQISRRDRLNKESICSSFFVHLWNSLTYFVVRLITFAFVGLKKPTAILDAIQLPLFNLLTGRPNELKHVVFSNT